MKGYVVNSGYMGYVNGKYILFTTEEEYKEYLESDNNSENIEKST